MLQLRKINLIRLVMASSPRMNNSVIGMWGVEILTLDNVRLEVASLPRMYSSVIGIWGVEISMPANVRLAMVSAPVILIFAVAVPAKMIKNNSGMNIYEIFILFIPYIAEWLYNRTCAAPALAQGYAQFSSIICGEFFDKL